MATGRRLAVAKAGGMNSMLRLRATLLRCVCNELEHCIISGVDRPVAKLLGAMQPAGDRNERCFSDPALHEHTVKALMHQAAHSRHQWGASQLVSSRWH